MKFVDFSKLLRIEKVKFLEDVFKIVRLFEFLKDEIVKLVSYFSDVIYIWVLYDEVMY